jgi:flagellar motor switch protein FliM
LTDIENRLAGRWAELVVHDLQATLGEDLPSVVPERSVNEPTARLPPAAAKELAACSEFQVKVGQTSGVLRLAVPWAVFERASRSLAESPQRAFRTRDPNATVDVSVTLAQTAVPAHEVADLQVGDVIATETAVGDLFEVTIDGQPAFRARVGSSDGRKAVKIEEVIEPE